MKPKHFFCIILLIPAFLQAQSGSESVRLPGVTPAGIRQARESVLDRDSILIGDQVWWILSLPDQARDPSFTRSVESPEMPGEAVEGVEILEGVRFDTIFHRKKMQEIQARIKLTSFDSGSYSLPYMPLFLKRVDGGTDTLWFKGPVLYVNTIPVDTTSFKAYGLKPQMKYPITAAEILSVAGLLLALAAIVYLTVRIIRRRRQNLPLFHSLKPAEPPHVVALKALDKIRAQQLWKTQKVKHYYTVLTDVLRIYFYNRWGIQAMEQTSAEMLGSLNSVSEKDELLTKEVITELQKVLNTSDLVKFAKYVPAENENEESLALAVKFVTSTARYEETENKEE